MEKLSFQFVDLGKREQKSEAFRAKNHSGTIPILEFADGTILLEAVAITQYVDNIDGNPVLTGVNPLEQGLIHMWTRKVESEFLEPITVCFHNCTSGLGPDVVKWGLRQRERALKGMEFFDNLLKSRPFIAGDKFSMADIAAIGAVECLPLIRERIPKELHHLLAWHNRALQHTSVQAYFRLIREN